MSKRGKSTRKCLDNKYIVQKVPKPARAPTPAYVSGIPGSLEQRRVGGKSVRRGPKASRHKVFPIIILLFSMTDQDQ